jgi:hypothetical protein
VVDDPEGLGVLGAGPRLAITEVPMLSMRPHLHRTILAVLVTLAATAGIAAGGDKRGKQNRYVGIHPIAKTHGGGLCHIEVPHVHVYAPTAMVQYREHDDGHYFVGDPVAYGWDGDRTSYYGHHPIHIDAVIDAGEPGEPVFCYLDGPHFHAFAPPRAIVDVDWRLEGDAYFYVGTPPPVYVEARPQLVKINAIYTPIEYDRPVVTVEPPSAWIGITYPVAVVAPRGAVVVDGPAVRGGVEVVAPSVVVRPPSIEIGIGVDVGFGGGVVVGSPPHRHKHKHKGKWKHGKGKGRW